MGVSFEFFKKYTPITYILTVFVLYLNYPEVRMNIYMLKFFNENNKE